MIMYSYDNGAQLTDSLGYLQSGTPITRKNLGLRTTRHDRQNDHGLTASPILSAS